MKTREQEGRIIANVPSNLETSSHTLQSLVFVGFIVVDSIVGKVKDAVPALHRTQNRRDLTYRQRRIGFRFDTVAFDFSGRTFSPATFGNQVPYECW